jgi:predicted O-linked N-acetylglucosamine transferase (SPINDLY family)
MPTTDSQQTFARAVKAHQAGQIKDAEQLYRLTLSQQPDFFQAAFNLGILFGAARRWSDAIIAFKEVVARHPQNSDAWIKLGIAAQANRQLDEAAAALRKAVALRPADDAPLCFLADVLKDSGQLDESIANYGRAIALRQTNADAHFGLADALVLKGDQPQQALAAIRRCVVLRPNYAQAWHRLGRILIGLDQNSSAIAAYQKAIALKPDFAWAHYNLAAALLRIGRLDNAIASLERVLALQPDYPLARLNLGVALWQSGRRAAAVAAFAQEVADHPDLPEAHINLANALRDEGQFDEALRTYDRAIALRPLQASFLSNRVYALLFHPRFDVTALLAEHKRWDELHGHPPRDKLRPHNNDRSADRALRIGYVSPDFRDHVAGRNVLPLLREHDRGQFQVFCYSNKYWADPMTSRFRALADQWRDITDLDDDRAADLIRDDSIDILVDLSLHMAHNRLPLFARKPAPVQLTVGYPGGTGLAAMDYRLTDPYLDPPAPAGAPDPADAAYVEKSIRLPHSFWCYDAEGMDLAIAPDPGPLPAIKNGHITFGSLNNFCKVSDDALALWAQVLAAVPDSRLMVLAPGDMARQRVLSRLSDGGIDAIRITFLDNRPRAQYLQFFQAIDICLDTIPYNGHTTSLDSFWMGVPVVTLIGRTVVGRAGWSQLTNLHLPELAAHTPQEFVQIATTLAADRPRLTDLRATLRQRMTNSPLTDAQVFARSIEAAYRQIWHHWCQQPPKAP